MIIENHSLKPYNTFGIDARARYFAEITQEEDLVSILRNQVGVHPLLVLGGGSNVLFTDDFPGYVLHLNLKGREEKFLNEDYVEVTASAGENWDEFVQFCVGKNYGGLENLSLIPGNVGTSPVQNIGAYGVEIKDHFLRCEVLDLSDFEVKILQKDACRFGYRDSIFKGEAKGRFIILQVTFLLKRHAHRLSIGYGDIARKLEDQGLITPTIADVRRAVIAIRQSKLPNPRIIGNAGSFFKNPVVPAVVLEKIQQKYPLIPFYPQENGVKIPAGWLIENAGWKGRQIGNVASSPTQALVLINATGQATGREVFDFSQLIIDDIRQKFGITLEREVNVIG